MFRGRADVGVESRTSPQTGYDDGLAKWDRYRPRRSGNQGDAFLADELLAAELAAEQSFVDRVYVQLERSSRNAQAIAREGHGRGRLGHEGGLVERDAMVFQAAKRIAQLDAAHEGLVFGRLDLQEHV